MLVAAASVLIFAGGALIFSRLFPRWLEVTADYSLLIVVSFALVLLLNVYICPYKSKLRELLPGTLITMAAWAVTLIGFTIYLKIGNMGRLYGALSAIIVFMLWLYVLMICFVAGVILTAKKFLPAKARNCNHRKRAGQNGAEKTLSSYQKRFRDRKYRVKSGAAGPFS